MRAIKFRAWDRIHKQLLRVTNLQLTDAGHRGGTISSWFKSSEGYDFLLVQGETMDLMQFTGRSDSNGREIFEGDICRNKQLIEQTDAYVERLNEVEYWSDTQSYSGCQSPIQGTCEVIGNKFENPELC